MKVCWLILKHMCIWPNSTRSVLMYFNVYTCVNTVKYEVLGNTPWGAWFMWLLRKIKCTCFFITTQIPKLPFGVPKHFIFDSEGKQKISEHRIHFVTWNSTINSGCMEYMYELAEVPNMHQKKRMTIMCLIFYFEVISKS